MANLSTVVLGLLMKLQGSYSGFFKRVTPAIVRQEDVVIGGGNTIVVPSLSNALIENSSRGTNIAASVEDAVGTQVTLDTYIQKIKAIPGLSMAMIDSGELTPTAAANLKSMVENLYNRFLASAEKLARTKLMGLGTVLTDDAEDPDYDEITVDNIGHKLNKAISIVSDFVDGEIVAELSPEAYRIAIEAKLLYDTEMSAAVAATGRLGMFGGAECFKIKSSVTPAKLQFCVYSKSGIVYAQTGPEAMYYNLIDVQTMPGACGISMNFAGGAGAMLDTETPGAKSEAFVTKLSAAL